MNGEKGLKRNWQDCMCLAAITGCIKAQRIQWNYTTSDTMNHVDEDFMS